MSKGYIIRQLRVEDLSLYKAMRLEALLNDAGMYGRSYEDESKMTDAEWKGRLMDPLSAYFGLFDDDRLIGITGIVVEKDRPDEGYMTHSYLQKEYRGKKLSKMFYDTRIAWGREHGPRKLVIGHKESNLPSKAAILSYDFVFTHQVERVWPDESVEGMVYYEIGL